MSEDCLFCRIIRGEVPAERVGEGNNWIAFNDIAPQAETHFLVIPKSHVTSLQEVSNDDASAADALTAIPKLAEQAGIAAQGYRVVTNVGKDGGQTVDHLHFHVLGGRNMKWPPG